MASRRPQRPCGCPWGAPRGPPRGPKTQETHTTNVQLFVKDFSVLPFSGFQRFKKAQRGHQDRPKTAQEAPEEGPKTTHEGTKTTHEAHNPAQEALRTAPRGDPGGHRNSRSEIMCIKIVFREAAWGHAESLRKCTRHQGHHASEHCTI
eukprot:3764165-Pyramimonas_sp.AAC.1